MSSCINLIKEPREKGTAVFILTPEDQDGVIIEFSGLKDPEFAIFTEQGTVVTGTDFGDIDMVGIDTDVDGETKNLPCAIVSGDILAIFGTDDEGKRKFSFQAKYDSTIGGVLHVDLPLNEEANFKIKKLVGQTDEAVL